MCAKQIYSTLGSLQTTMVIQRVPSVLKESFATASGEIIALPTQSDVPAKQSSALERLGFACMRMERARLQTQLPGV